MSMLTLYYIFFGIALNCISPYIPSPVSSTVGQIQDSLQVLRRLEIKAISLHGAFSNQCIVVTPGHEILKINIKGEIKARYSNRYLGPPQIIYAENLLQVVLFYAKYQTIIILDQALNELKRIRLTDFNVPFSSTVGYTAEHEIWYYDYQVLKLKKMNKNGIVVLESLLIFQNILPKELRSIWVRRNEILVEADSNKYVRLNTFGHVLHQFECPGVLFSFEDLVHKYFDQKSQTIIKYMPKLKSFTAPFSLPATITLSRLLSMSAGLMAIQQDQRLILFSPIQE